MDHYEEFWNDMPNVWIGVSLKLPKNQAYYYSPLVNKMEQWCKNNCKTDFFTVIHTDGSLIVRFMCVESNRCDQATIDATAFKLRWM